VVKFSLILLLLVQTSSAYGDEASAITAMKASWKKTKDYSAVLHVRQRVDGKLYAEQQTQFKFRGPSEMYAKRLNEPNKNAEALYRGSKWNEGKIKANKGSFPNLTLSLDPYGSMAMSGQNHPMPEAHLGYFIGLIVSDFEKAQKEGVTSLKSLGASSVDGRSCQKVSFSTNPKSGSSYSPKKGDSWRSISKANAVDVLALRTQNAGKKLDDPAVSLFVPVYYASKWELCIDDKSGLPLSFISYDTAGNAFDQYELSQFQYNTGLTDDDFDPSNKAYKF
jgi:outer membrane lipoprotein-sorting protein